MTPGLGAPQTQRFSAPTADTTLSEALITLRKRLPIIIVCVLVGLTYGFYKALTQIKVYEAFGIIEVNSGSSDEYRLSPGAFFGEDPQRKMLTEESILTSDSARSKGRARPTTSPITPPFSAAKPRPGTRVSTTQPCATVSSEPCRPAFTSPRFRRPA